MDDGEAFRPLTPGRLRVVKKQCVKLISSSYTPYYSGCVVTTRNKEGSSGGYEASIDLEDDEEVGSSSSSGKM